MEARSRGGCEGERECGKGLRVHGLVPSRIEKCGGGLLVLELTALSFQASGLSSALST